LEISMENENLASMLALIIVALRTADRLESLDLAPPLHAKVLRESALDALEAVQQELP